MKPEGITAQPIETYPKGVRGKMEQIFNKAQLPLVGSERDGKVPRSREYSVGIKESPRPNSLDPEAAAFNVRFPQVLDGLLVQSGETAEKYVAGIGGYDYTQAASLAQMIAEQQNTGKRVAARVIFGGTTEMQFRALSMLLPSLQQLDRITSAQHGTISASLPPQLQVVFANNIASHLNTMDYAQLAGQTRRFIDTATNYVDEFFPQLTEQMVFLEDAPIIDGSYIKNELERLGVLASKELPPDLRERMQTKVFGGNGNSMKYAGAHLLFHDTNNDELYRPIKTNKADTFVPDAIISVGGRQEKDFYHSRFALRELAGKSYTLPTLQFFTKHSVPPYYAARGGDISLDSVLQGEKDPREARHIDPLAKYDIDYFVAVSSNRGDIDAFLAHEQERMKSI